MVIMLTASSIFGLVNSYAGTGSDLRGYNKIFISAEIKRGHDIYDIAHENLPKEMEENEENYIDQYLSEVIRINHVYNLSDLDAGEHIIVPSYR